MKYLKNYNTFILEKLYMNFSNNGLTTLIGLNIPEFCDDYFDCSDNKLTTLKGAPKEVGSFLDCNNNELTTLEGSPIKVGGQFNCSFNKLTTVKGELEYVGESFDCSNNLLTNLEYLPEYINGNLYCYNNDWSKPIFYDIMKKYKLHSLKISNGDFKWIYTTEQFDKFSSFEFQKEFLESEPENYLDLKPFKYAKGIEELFPHLFDMDELGLLY